MTMQLPRTFILFTVLSGCILIGCSHIKVKETESESESINSTELSFAFLAEESPSVKSEVNDKNEGYTEMKETNQEPSTDDSALKTFSINDIFVSGKPFREDRPFMLVNINDIASAGHALKKTESVERANGHFIYWEDEGIIYVTHSSDTHLVSLILNRSGSALNCGLKIGMKEPEIQLLDLPFEKFEKEELFDESKSLTFASNVIRDEKNPINTEDFDSLYVYIGSIPEEEMLEYRINTTSCVSIVAFIKNETVSNIILDMPTAG